jgi:hypothetical protein
MKLLVAGVASLVLTIVQVSPSNEIGLLGCPSPSEMADSLTKLRQNSWRTISVERILSIWPSHFDELACESQKGCRLLVSKDRVIRGHCECCESFAFDVERNEDGSRSEHLSNIIVHYSAHSKEEVVDAARKVARGAGLSDAEAATVGRDSVQRYEWKDSRQQVRQSYILELRFTREDRNWELYLSVGAEAT